MKISILIPALNEEKLLERALRSARAEPAHEIIVVDGGSSDRTCEIAGRYADIVVSCRANRARQMNLGASLATGSILLFLHADCILPPGALSAIARACRDPEVVGGAFEFKLDSPRPLMRAISYLSRLRARALKLPYGDHGIFVKREVFRAMGGFRELPIMEDFDFSRRLKRRGKISFIGCCILASARRWEQNGIIATALVNWLLALCFVLGVPAERLERWYTGALMRLGARRRPVIGSRCNML